MHKCKHCNGFGEVETYDCWGKTERYICPYCKGKGYFQDKCEYEYRIYEIEEKAKEDERIRWINCYDEGIKNTKNDNW